MNHFLSILAAIFILGILIMLHELGHYLAGRLLKLPVVEFAIGMGPRLLGFTRKGIDYTIRAFPIGGFCAFNGEDDPDADLALPAQEERADIPPEWRNLNNCPAWRRLIMQFSGSAMNFLAAYLCAVILLCAVGIPVSLSRVDQVEAGGPAAMAGIQAGDVVLAVNGDETASLSAVIQENPEKAVNITLMRGNETVNAEVTPMFFEDTQSMRIGIMFGAYYHQLSLTEGISSGASYCVEITKETLNALRGLIFRGEGAGEVMGIVGTVNFMATETTNYMNAGLRSGVYMLVLLTLFIALNLGIINLLPIPALDGGRIVFTLYELIVRRPFPRKAEALTHTVGFALLIGLMVLLFFNDILRLTGIGGGA